MKIKKDIRKMKRLLTYTEDKVDIVIVLGWCMFHILKHIIILFLYGAAVYVVLSTFFKHTFVSLIIFGMVAVLFVVWCAIYLSDNKY